MGLGTTAAAALTPELQSKAVEQALSIQAAPLDAAYKTALTDYYQGMPSFEQKAGLQLMNTLLGKTEPRGAVPPNLQYRSGVPGGEIGQTGGKFYDVWFDPKTAQVVRVLGESRQAAPGAGPNLANQWLAMDRRISRSVMQEMAFEGLGKLVTLPNGDMTINFNTPERDLADYRRRLEKRIGYEKGRGSLPPNWYSPSLGLQQEGGNGGRTHFPNSLEEARNVPTGDFFIYNNQAYKKTAGGAVKLED